MKIGFVLDDSLDSSDGVQQYVLTLGRWLTSQGHEVHYLVGQTSRSDVPHVHSLSRNIAVRFNGNRMSMPRPAPRRDLQALLAKEQFDILHVQMPYSPWLAGRIIKLALARTVVVGTFHILPYGRLQYWGARALSWWVRGTTAHLRQIWSVSEPAQTFARQLGIDSTVLPNVIDLQQFAVKQPVRSKGFELVFLGRLVERKGCAELLKAFQLLVKKVPEAHLTIGGKGPQLVALQRWVTQQQLAKAVTFAGYVAEKDKPQFLAADVAIFPSLGGESFGIVLLEAMAAGAGVVIGGDNPGYTSVLGSLPQTLVNAADAQALASCLQKLHDDQSLRSELHTKQQALVKHYDVATVGKKLVSYYQDAITQQA